MKISKITLYDEPTVTEIQLKRLKEFLKSLFSVEVEIRNNFFENIEETAFEKIAGTRIFDLKKPFQRHNPSKDEILLENENKDVTNDKEMVLYDGFELQKIISEYLPTSDNVIENLQIIFTNKLVCTFDENDFRYHARAVIGSNPTVISTTGMIEAPAKPKQYYLDLMTNFSEEKIDEIKHRYKGEFLEYHDSRLSEIAEGYLLQAIMYYETGEAFCEHKECRLFNAHWQKDLFHSQLESKKFCKRHQLIFEKIKQN